MNKRSIWIIICLMSLALIGIVFIQIYWINWFVRLNEKNFDDRVYLTLNSVKSKLTQEIENPGDALSLIGSQSKLLEDSNKTLADKYSNILSKYDKYNRQRLIFELNSLNRNINPEELLYQVKPEMLSNLLNGALLDQGIELKYDYGVYSNESNDFFLINDSYVPDLGSTEEASNITMLKGLYNTKYKVQLFPTEFETPGYLAVHFQNRRGLLWSSVIPWLLGSVLFTGLILFCFSYTIFVIFKQKKVGEMKSDFINNMTHEFKTPIATISLAADSINNPMITNNPEKVRRFAGIIKQENKRMLNQVEKVLQMAQIEKQDLELNIAPVNIEEVINQAVENTQLKIQAREGSLISEINIKDPMIEVDQTHVSNMIHNLLDNANKYSPNAPEIKLTAHDTSQGVFIAVEDKGIGMTNDTIKFIFEKFYRVHTGNLHDVKGFGLGLSYVKVMTDAHHGKINVKSTIDKGSTFELYLPRKHS